MPAVLGDNPAFDALVPIVRPLMPAVGEFDEALREVLNSGMLTNGRHVRAFESALADSLGVRHAVCLSSCTAGMMLLFRGLGLEGEIIVPSFTFMASASAIVWAGCTPVFADIDEASMTVDPEAVEAAVTPRTCAVLAVHMFGCPAPVEALAQIAGRRGLRLFYDAAHAVGSLRQGRAVCAFGDASAYSLSPTKLVTAGEGGIVTTDSDELAEIVRTGRNYGIAGDYDCAFPGLNARMTEAQALLGLASFRRLASAVERRGRIAALYRDRLGALPGLALQRLRDGDRSSYKDFTIRIDPAAFGLSRDGLSEALRAENIDTRKYFHPPCHRLTAFRRCAAPDADLARTERVSTRCLSLPIWSGMEIETASRICEAIEALHVNAASVAEKLDTTG